MRLSWLLCTEWESSPFGCFLEITEVSDDPYRMFLFNPAEWKGKGWDGGERWVFFQDVDEKKKLSKQQGCREIRQQNKLPNKAVRCWLERTGIFWNLG